MQVLDSDSFQHGCFFEDRGSQKLETSLDPKSSFSNSNADSSNDFYGYAEIIQEKKAKTRLKLKDFCQNTNSPYLLGTEPLLTDNEEINLE